MTTEQILSEIKSIDVDSLEKGMSIVDHFTKTNKQYPAEALLLHVQGDDIGKWYYNYTEKLLRRIEVNFKNINDENKFEQHWLNAISDEDESVIPFTAEQFANKIVVYNDWHKLVTYDEKTGHYECFFVDIVEGIAKEIMKNIDEYNGNNNIDPPTIDELMEDDIQFSKACTSISDWMLDNDIISELRFTNTPNGIKLDLVQSMLFTGHSNSDTDELGKPDSLD